MDFITIAISIALLGTGMLCIVRSARAVTESKRVRLSISVLGVAALVLAVLNLVESGNQITAGRAWLIRWVTWFVFFAAVGTFILAKIREGGNQTQIRS